MKYVLTVFLLAAIAGCQPSLVTLSAKDQKLIEASSIKWVDTYNQNDWKGLSTLFSPDGILMPPNSAAVHGREAIAAWEMENESGFRIALDIQKIDGSDVTAYVRGRSCLYVPVGDGEYGVDVGKFLEIRKKQEDGEWLIHTDIFNSDAALGSQLLETCPFPIIENTLAEPIK
ncbi:MAG: ketosteroid isomerase-like protein [Paraglaciecola sp.]|jgi:ketosteroid isomerase-like protein